MQVYDGSSALDARHRGCVLTIGNFDGVHRGHRALLDAVLQRGRELGRPSVLYTFHPHPRRVLTPELAGPQLMLRDQLVCELEAVGLDAVIREPFTREFSEQSPQTWLEQVLIRAIGPCEIFVGADFRFGRGREGSDELLSRAGPERGVGVHIIPQVKLDGAVVSSTRIREALGRGDVADAAAGLGRAYEIWGTVVEGARRGRELGFPTANLETENELVPPNGVYATRVRLFDGERPGSRVYEGVTNVGTRPTFEPGRVSIETHLIEFDGDLYGQRMALGFCQFIRAEQRFDGPDALREQIARDVLSAREFHAGAA